VFLALWIVIFAAMGYYLLGKLRFLQKSAMNTVSVPRLFLAIIVLAFTVYMVPGLWGAPLKSISAFLPPQSTQDFDLYTPTLNGDHISGDLKMPHKYATLFRAPLNFDAFFDYDEGVAYARSVGKPVLIDFTGHACVNCRKMETNVWSDKRISKRISQDYVLIQLYVDDKTELTDLEQTGPVKGKIFKTIGSKWSNLQAEMFQSNSQPFYVLLDNNGKQLMTPSGAIYDQTGYLNFLESGLKAFLKKNRILFVRVRWHR
jgi:thioredoxin-related protein